MSVGDEVELTGRREGVVRWIGEMPERPSSTGIIFYGVELKTPTDRGTDGRYRNKVYFKCKEKSGLFLKRRYIVKNNSTGKAVGKTSNVTSRRAKAKDAKNIMAGKEIFKVTSIMKGEATSTDSRVGSINLKYEIQKVYVVFSFYML